MLYLRQSTAVTVTVGPFVDTADGFTALTSLTLSQADIRLSKNDGAFAQKNQASSATHKENGYYSVSLDTTDTGTVGHLRLAVNESGAMPVWQDYTVLEEAVYDAFYAGGATAAVPVTANGINAAAIADNAIDAGALGATALEAIAAAVRSANAEHIRIGTAQDDGSGANTLVLAVADQEADDFYNGHIVILLEGGGTTGLTPTRRTRQITDYVNSSNQITVDRNWEATVGAGSIYLIIG